MVLDSHFLAFNAIRGNDKVGFEEGETCRSLLRIKVRLSPLHFLRADFEQEIQTKTIMSARQFSDGLWPQ